MINQQQKDIINEYARIKSDIKLLEEKADELNPQVLEAMGGNGIEEIEVSGLGKLSLGSRRTWKYTPQTIEEENSLKAAKREEEQTGEASYIEKHYVIFKANKDD